MAESIQQQIGLLETAKTSLEQAVPLLITQGRTGEGLQAIIDAAGQLEQIQADPNFSQLATNLKILANSDASILSTVTFQAFIVDILEMIVTMSEAAKDSGELQTTSVVKMNHVAEYLLRLSGRITNRYKLNVLFEPEYEAKSLRAFMVVKELSGVVKFLNIAPDISENQNANLDNGLEIDCLSQEGPEGLHKIAGSVLEVQNVQVFRETRPAPVDMLDPPTAANSFDSKIADFLNT